MKGRGAVEPLLQQFVWHIKSSSQLTIANLRKLFEKWVDKLVDFDLFSQYDNDSLCPLRSNEQLFQFPARAVIFYSINKHLNTDHSIIACSKTNKISTHDRNIKIEDKNVDQKQVSNNSNSNNGDDKTKSSIDDKMKQDLFTYNSKKQVIKVKELSLQTKEQFEWTMKQNREIKVLAIKSDRVSC